MVSTFPTPNLGPDTIRVRVCEDLYPIARDHAVAAITDTPALRFDAATAIAAEHGAQFPQAPPGEPLTAMDARRLAGHRTEPGREYTLPATLDEATTVLLDLAAEHVRGRTGYQADRVAAARLRLDRTLLGDPGLPDRRQT